MIEINNTVKWYVFFVFLSFQFDLSLKTICNCEGNMNAQSVISMHRLEQNKKSCLSDMLLFFILRLFFFQKRSSNSFPGCAPTNTALSDCAFFFLICHMLYCHRIGEGGGGGSVNKQCNTHFLTAVSVKACMISPKLPIDQDLSMPVSKLRQPSLKIGMRNLIKPFFSTNLIKKYKSNVWMLQSFQ